MRKVDIVLPDSVKELGLRCFEGRGSLRSIVVPDGVTSIGEYTFSECTSLKSVVVGGSVTPIRAWAFGNCPTLTDVYYRGSEEDKKNMDIGPYTALGRATWHYNWKGNIPE